MAEETVMILLVSLCSDFFFPSSLLLLNKFNLGIGYILNTSEAGWGNKVDANLRRAWAITVSFRPAWPS